MEIVLASTYQINKIRVLVGEVGESL